MIAARVPDHLVHSFGEGLDLFGTAPSTSTPRFPPAIAPIAWTTFFERREAPAHHQEDDHRHAGESLDADEKRDQYRPARRLAERRHVRNDDHDADGLVVCALERELARGPRGAARRD